ncbi:hypothetical protein FrEUN1fDRAFT_0966 [Parafrankia sp. EUN1f]|nr:hypothetical protein FrEUN1fDRAFT_0966 [Parafrankia sp. EUN1f]
MVRRAIFIAAVVLAALLPMAVANAAPRNRVVLPETSPSGAVTCPYDLTYQGGRCVPPQTSEVGSGCGGNTAGGTTVGGCGGNTAGGTTVGGGGGTSNVAFGPMKPMKRP